MVEIDKQSGYIFDSTRESLMNQLSRCQRLQEEGISTGSLQEETWENLQKLIEQKDEHRLGQLRQELKEL